MISEPWETLTEKSGLGILAFGIDGRGYHHGIRASIFTIYDLGSVEWLSQLHIFSSMDTRVNASCLDTLDILPPVFW